MPPYDGYQSKRLQVRASFFLAFNQKQGDPGFVRIIYIYRIKCVNSIELQCVLCYLGTASFKSTLVTRHNKSEKKKK